MDEAFLFWVVCVAGEKRVRSYIWLLNEIGGN